LSVRSPTADDVKKILSAVDAKADDACLKKVIDEMAGKDLETIISEGTGMFAQVLLCARCFLVGSGGNPC